MKNFPQSISIMDDSRMEVEEQISSVMLMGRKFCLLQARKDVFVGNLVDRARFLANSNVSFVNVNLF